MGNSCLSCRGLCGSGAGAPESADEPVYERLGQHQAHDFDEPRSILIIRETADGMYDVRRRLVPVAAMEETMRRLEQTNPLLVVDEEEYLDLNMILNVLSPSPAVDIYEHWLQERIDYGEPW